MTQAPLFNHFVGPGFWGHAWLCFRAALGDVLIARVRYAAAALVTRRAAWLFQNQLAIALIQPPPRIVFRASGKRQRAAAA